MSRHIGLFVICVIINVVFTGSKTSGGSLKLEMAQEGFSAAYVPGVIKKLCNIVSKTYAATVNAKQCKYYSHPLCLLVFYANICLVCLVTTQLGYDNWDEV